jgi:hypothetical protein
MALYRTLEYYSVPLTDNHTIEHFYYVKKQLPEQVHSSLIDLLTWYIAYDACMAMKDIEGAKIAMQKIKEIEMAETK